MKFFELLSLAMRLRKREGQVKLVVKSVFGGPKNLLLKKNVMVSCTLASATIMDLRA
jgi:hypothetical protein